jgi:signal transduction histidine kinase
MRQPHHAAAEPRILPLPTAGIAVRDLLDEAVAAAVARAPAGVAVTVDTPSGARIAAEPGGLRGLLDRLVTAAVAAAPRSRGDGPPLREVVITVVETAEAVEFEIADSGPTTPADERCPAVMRDLAARCGCGLHVATCPEGGMAVTVRLPRREARRQAA